VRYVEELLRVIGVAGRRALADEGEADLKPRGELSI
jgi:hypothetical protein